MEQLTGMEPSIAQPGSAGEGTDVTHRAKKSNLKRGRNVWCKRYHLIQSLIFENPVKRWRRFNKYQRALAVLIVLSMLAGGAYLVWYLLQDYMWIDTTVGNDQWSVERRLVEALKMDKGQGCKLPKLDPFETEMMSLKKIKQLHCRGKDWVKCYLHECRVVREILDKVDDIKCEYRDLIYVNDRVAALYGPRKVVRDDGVYTLDRSDHVKVWCSGITAGSSWWNIFQWQSWKGWAGGYRRIRKQPVEGRESAQNVLIVGFDSLARMAAMRLMPKTYSVLKDDLQATILESYNILGDATPATLWPLLTGRPVNELPECRRGIAGSKPIAPEHFIFHKLHREGYRTLLFENMPWFGTFQQRYIGFTTPPADHYIYPLLDDYVGQGIPRKEPTQQWLCFGDTPNFKFLLNLTEQFFKLDGKRFAFTFIADMTHDDINYATAADEDTAHFLKTFKDHGHLNDTVLIVMGDHGQRYRNKKVKIPAQNRFEERLPFMAIRLSDQILASRPEARKHLEGNVHVLTTPHDVHATLLDVLDLRQYTNHYRVPGAELPRALNLLQPIPETRSCSEAGIETHWCACVNWQPVPTSDSMYERMAQSLVQHINGLTSFVRSKCALRTLKVISNVNKMQIFNSTTINNGTKTKQWPPKWPVDNYQVKVTVGPGDAIFEATLRHFKDNDTISASDEEISRLTKWCLAPKLGYPVPWEARTRIPCAMGSHLSSLSFCRHLKGTKHLVVCSRQGTLHDRPAGIWNVEAVSFSEFMTFIFKSDLFD